ncbi:MAG TPA: cytochrome c [Candidatus Eisenbacteria bacterium]|nr:cytochrome c [Candidatus Eisenbacteria bacterium]
MRHLPVQLLLIAAAVLVIAGCGGGSKSGSENAAAASASGVAASPGSGALPTTLDQGPRAGETPSDEAKAKAGERLFKDKGCSACHAFGKRVTGPDLAGVTMRRTAAWMESQILHPDRMVKEDPISRQLFAQYALQMPNQGLTSEEARAVIEYFKDRDHEAAEGHAAGKEKH